MKILRKEYASLGEITAEMRAHGIAAMRLSYDPMAEEGTGYAPMELTLSADFRAPEEPEQPIMFDHDPAANALAQKEWEKKRAIKQELERQADEDRTRFAATDGVP
jgi:hypothetical protein